MNGTTSRTKVAKTSYMKSRASSVIQPRLGYSFQQELNKEGKVRFQEVRKHNFLKELKEPDIDPSKMFRSYYSKD